MVIEDVIKKMLVVNPAKRIEWGELFKHPIVRFREEKLENGLKQSLLCEKNELGFNMSKFYIKSNMVVENTHEIVEKSEFNGYLKDVMNNETHKAYTGAIIKRETERISKQGAKENKDQDTFTLPTNK